MLGSIIQFFPGQNVCPPKKKIFDDFLQPVLIPYISVFSVGTVHFWGNDI